MWLHYMWSATDPACAMTPVQAIWQREHFANIEGHTIVFGEKTTAPRGPQVGLFFCSYGTQPVMAKALGSWIRWRKRRRRLEMNFSSYIMHPDCFCRAALSLSYNPVMIAGLPYFFFFFFVGFIPFLAFFFFGYFISWLVFSSSLDVSLILLLLFF